MNRGPARVEVLDPVDRILHFAVLAGVVSALATGPLLGFPGLRAGVGVDSATAAAVHAVGAAAALLGGAFHLVKVCLAWLEGRNPWGLLLRPADLASLAMGAAWALKLSSQRPPLGRFSYRERLPYGAWLGLLPFLAFTGWVAAHPGRTSVLGADFLVRAAHLHALAGLLVVAVLLWHVYFALLQPAALYWNGSWITGRVPWERVEGMRPDWARQLLDELAPAAAVEEVPSVEDLLEAGNRSAREGRFEEASRAYEEALTLYPGYGQALFNLGVVRFRAGDRLGAIDALERFLAQDPFGAVAPRARELLERCREAEGSP